MPLKPGNWCYGCGAYDVEPAAVGCKNPGWHIPDAVKAAEALELERRENEVRLPYAED